MVADAKNNEGKPLYLLAAIKGNIKIKFQEMKVMRSDGRKTRNAMRLCGCER